MVQVDIPAAFAFGQLYAYLSRDYLKKEENLFQSRLLGPLNLYFAAGFAPVGMFLMIGWPAWEMMYVTDWVENPFNKPFVSGFYVLFGIAMVVIGNIGYITAHKWYLNSKDKWVLYGLATSAFLMVLPFLLRWGIWLHVGTYKDIQAKSGYPFWEAPFFHGWLFVMSYFLMVAVLAGTWFRKKAKELA